VRIRAAVQGLGEIGPPAVAAVPALIAAYNQALAHQHTLAQFAIPSALGRIAPNSPVAPDAVAALVRALDSKNQSIRNGAVEALGQFGKDAAAAIPKLRALQDDPDTFMRSVAARSLAALGVAPQPKPGTARAAGRPQ
jgi:HEAT repeat protein